MKKCLPIQGSSLEITRHVIRRNRDRYDAFELWLDYLPPEEISQVQGVVDTADKDYILLFRRENLAPSVLPIEARKKWIGTLQNSNILWDFDINVQEEELTFYREEKRDSSLLCSYHHYERTPTHDELKKVLERMEAFSPDIVKFACYCHSAKDAVRLLDFLVCLRDFGQKAIVLGMGAEGLITRAFAGSFGCAYNFLPSATEKDLPQTAAGQLTLEDFTIIEEIIKKKK